MAQTGYTPISIYYSATTTNVPTAGNLVAGELAINTADGKLFYKDSSGVVQTLATKGGVGSSTTTQVIYNSSGSLAGSANMTFNGTTLTLANDASISGLTVGKGGGAIGTNAVLGNGAFSSNSSGAYSVAVGYLAAPANTSGEITAVGAFALQSNTTGNQLTAYGVGALGSNTSGSYNVALGRSALTSNTTASGNTAVGYQAGYSNTTGIQNIAIGTTALYSNTTGGQAVAIGYQSSYYQTGGSNVSLGYNSLLGAAGTSTGTANTAIGTLALFSNTTASNGTAVGYQALYNTTTGTQNTAVGYIAGQSNTTGPYNTFIGSYAGQGCTTGNQNIYLGYSAATNHTTGNSCIYIGSQGLTASSASVANELVIACQSPAGKGSGTGFISPAGGGVYQGNNSATWSITSDQRLKKNIVDNATGLSAISQIQVRNFEYRTKDEITELPSQNAIDIQGVQLGAIAQELQAILPDCVKTESTGVMSVDTTNLTWYLINAVKELNAKITALENK